MNHLQYGYARLRLIWTDVHHTGEDLMRFDIGHRNRCFIIIKLKIDTINPTIDTFKGCNTYVINPFSELLNNEKLIVRGKLIVNITEKGFHHIFNISPPLSEFGYNYSSL